MWLDKTDHSRELVKKSQLVSEKIDLYPYYAIMKKLILFIFLLTLTVKPVEVFASDSFYRAVASFVYGLPKLVENEQGGLCVYGYDQVVIAIEEKYKDVIFFRNEDQLSTGFSKNSCKVIYISRNKYNNNTLAIKLANEAKVVSIGTDDNFVEKGGMILVQIGRRNVELIIHHKNIKEFKTKFDPLLEGLVVN